MSLNVQKAADAAATVSIPTWLMSLVADWGPVVNFCVAVLTGIAVILAIVMKVYQIRELRKKQ